MPTVYDRQGTALTVDAARATLLLTRPGYTSAAKTVSLVPEKTERSKGGYKNHEK